MSTVVSRIQHLQGGNMYVTQHGTPQTRFGEFIEELSTNDRWVSNLCPRICDKGRSRQGQIVREEENFGRKKI